MSSYYFLFLLPIKFDDQSTFQVDNWVQYIVLHGICYLISGRNQYMVKKTKILGTK